MGCLCNSGPRDKRLIMVGLDAAGKSTILHRLKHNEMTVTVPTIGFNVETVVTEAGLQFTVWDLGGQDTTRSLWAHYFTGTHAIIFVVDSADRTRINAGANQKSNARFELHKLLNEPQLADATLLIYGNKQDLPNAANYDDLHSALGCDEINDNRNWTLQLTSAKTGEGIKEGLDWLAETLTNPPKKKK